MIDQTKYAMINLLLKSCLHSTVVMSSAVKVSAENLRAYGATFIQASIYAILHRHWTAYKTQPSIDHLIAEMTALFQSLPQMYGQAGEALQQELSAIGTDIVQPLASEVQPRPLVDLINQIYREIVGNAVVAQAAQEAALSGDYTQLVQQVNRVNANLGNAREPSDVLSKRNARPSKMLASGLDFLDRLLGGGFRIGNGYGVLAPSGGGKTTLAAQIAVSMAIQGFRPGLFFTEQTFDESELIDKFWALVANKPTSAFEPFTDESSFPPELVGETERTIAHTVRKNILAYDFSKRPGDMSEVRAIASGMSGPKPDILLIDWAGAFARKLMESKSVFADNETNALKYISDECAAVSREFAIPVVVFHQLNPDCKNPTMDYDHTNANMCRQFHFNLSYMLVVHPRDDNDVLVIKTTKGRWLGRSEQMVVLKGAYSRFESVNGYRKGRGKWIREGDEHKMPSDKVSRTTGDNRDVANWLKG
jgi:hypothetical protein